MRCLILFLISALMIGCSSDDELPCEDEGVMCTQNTNAVDAPEETTIQFELDQTFGVENYPEEEILGDVRALEVDDEGNVYVLDEKSHQLVSFAPSGDLRWSSGTYGEGPGEFVRPTSLVWNGGARLYLTNQFGSRIDVWNTDGTYEDTGTIDELGYHGTLVGITDDLLFLTTPGMEGDPTHIHVIDIENWTLVRSFDVGPSFDLPTNTGAGVDLSVDSAGIWTGHYDAYELRHYTTDGSLTQQFERSNIELLGIEADGDYRFHIHSRVSSPLQLPRGSLLVHLYWTNSPTTSGRQTNSDFQSLSAPDSTFRHALDLFDDKRHFQGRLQEGKGRSPEMGEIRLIGPDGFLYASSMTPYPQVRRYQIINAQ